MAKWGGIIFLAGFSLLWTALAVLALRYIRFGAPRWQSHWGRRGAPRSCAQHPIHPSIRTQFPTQMLTSTTRPFADVHPGTKRRLHIEQEAPGAPREWTDAAGAAAGDGGGGATKSAAGARGRDAFGLFGGAGPESLTGASAGLYGAISGGRPGLGSEGGARTPVGYFLTPADEVPADSPLYRRAAAAGGDATAASAQPPPAGGQVEPLSPGAVAVMPAPLPSPAAPGSSPAAAASGGSAAVAAAAAKQAATRRRVADTLSNAPPPLPFPRVTLAFRDVTYTVRPRGGGDKHLLRGITAYCRPGSLTALMGASGAG